MEKIGFDWKLALAQERVKIAEKAGSSTENRPASPSPKAKSKADKATAKAKAKGKAKADAKPKKKDDGTAAKRTSSAPSRTSFLQAAPAESQEDRDKALGRMGNRLTAGMPSLNLCRDFMNGKCKNKDGECPHGDHVSTENWINQAIGASKATAKDLIHSGVVILPKQK